MLVIVFALSVHFVVYCQSLNNLITILKYKYERSAIRFHLFALNLKYCGCVVAHMIIYSTLGTQLHVRIIIKSSWKIHIVLNSPHLQDTFDNASSVNLNINHQHQILNIRITTQEYAWSLQITRVSAKKGTFIFSVFAFCTLQMSLSLSQLLY